MALVFNTTGSDFNPLVFGGSPTAHARELTTGALLLGSFIGLILYGVSTHQFIRYVYFFWGRDGWWRKGLVLSVMVLDTAHSALCVHFNFYFLVLDVARLESTHVSIWSADVSVLRLAILGIFAGLIICLCQCYLAFVAHKLCKRYGLPVVIVAGLLTFGQLAMVVAATTLLFEGRSRGIIKVLNCTHSGMAVLANIILASATIYWLRKNRTGFSRTETMIRVLTVYLIHTGLLVGISTLLSLIFALVEPESELYAAIDIVATKIYAITLLATNYPRQNFIGRDSGPTSKCFSPNNTDSGTNSHLHHQGLIRSPPFPRSPNAGAHPSRASTFTGLDGIRVMTEVAVKSDVDSIHFTDESGGGFNDSKEDAVGDDEML